MGNQPSHISYIAGTWTSSAIVTIDGKKIAVPASLAKYDLKKCDSCRKRKKGCDGKIPCQQCSARGKPEECTRQIPRHKLEEALAAEAGSNTTNTTAEVAEMENGITKTSDGSKQKKKESNDESDEETSEMQHQIDIDSIGQNSVHYDDDSDAPIPRIDDPHTINRAMYERESSSSISSPASLPSSSDSEDENDNTAAAADDGNSFPQKGQEPVGMMTRKQQAGYGRLKAQRAAEKAQAEEYARQPKFVFSMPAVLERWDHKRCDRCRDRNKSCNGETPCDMCERDNVLDYRPCATHESEQKYKELVAEAREKQWDKFEDKNREMADIRAREKRKKATAKKLKLEIQLSKAQDKWRAAKGETLKNKVALNKALKRVEKIQKMKKKAADDEDGEWNDNDEQMLEKAIMMSVQKSGEEEDVDMDGVAGARMESGNMMQATPDLGVEGDDEMDETEEEL